MKECRARAKDAAKPRLEELELRRRAAVKEAGKEAAMWWAHSELVTNAFDVARAKALKTNAELRFHRFDGEGRIGVRSSQGIVLSSPPNVVTSGVTSAIAPCLRNAMPLLGARVRGNRRCLVQAARATHQVCGLRHGAFHRSQAGP